jgi:hypothetical protein
VIHFVTLAALAVATLLELRHADVVGLAMVVVTEVLP